MQDMLWFNQNAFASKDEWLRDFPIPLYGDGICAVATGLMHLMGYPIYPDVLRDNIEARLGIEGASMSSIFNEDGMNYPAFFAVLEQAFPVEVSRVIDVRQAQTAVYSDRRSVIAGNSGSVYLTESGIQHYHANHTLCFHTYKVRGDIYRASDSQICGGPAVEYPSGAFSRYIGSSIDAGKCYLMAIKD